MKQLHRDTEDARPLLACTLCDGMHGAGAFTAAPVDQDGMQGVRHADIPGEPVHAWKRSDIYMPSTFVVASSCFLRFNSAF